MPLVTNIDLAAHLDIPAVDIPLEDPAMLSPAPPMTETTASAEPALLTPADSGLTPASPAARSDVSSAEPEVSVPTETLTAADTPPYVEAEIRSDPESTGPPSPVPERQTTEQRAEEGLASETVGSAETEEDVADADKEEEMPSESLNLDEEEDEGILVSSQDF